MIGDLFDSPWKILIVAVVLIVLFGSKKLPDAARSLGKSMRILKTEVSDLHHDDKAEAEKPAPALAAQPNPQRRTSRRWTCFSSRSATFRPSSPRRRQPRSAAPRPPGPSTPRPASRLLRS